MVNGLCTQNADKIQSKKGFTLVELVVVIAILAILAAIAIPVVSGLMNNSVKTTAVANAHTLDYAIKQAQADIHVKNRSTYSFNYEVNPPRIVTLKAVVNNNGIGEDMFKNVNYKDKTYTLYWDTSISKVVLAESATATVDIEGEGINSSGTMISLSDNEKPSSLFGETGYKGDVSMKTLT